MHNIPVPTARPLRTHTYAHCTQTQQQKTKSNAHTTIPHRLQAAASCTRCGVDGSWGALTTYNTPLHTPGCMRCANLAAWDARQGQIETSFTNVHHTDYGQAVPHQSSMRECLLAHPAVQARRRLGTSSQTRCKSTKL
jgi:hypothetical protein